MIRSDGRRCCRDVNVKDYLESKEKTNCIVLGKGLKLIEGTPQIN